MVAQLKNSASRYSRFSAKAKMSASVTGSSACGNPCSKVRNNDQFVRSGRASFSLSILYVAVASTRRDTQPAGHSHAAGSPSARGRWLRLR